MAVIAQCRAARHPDRVAYTAIVAAAAEVSAWGKQVDSRWHRASLLGTLP